MLVRKESRGEDYFFSECSLWERAVGSLFRDFLASDSGSSSTWVVFTSILEESLHSAARSASSNLVVVGNLSEVIESYCVTSSRLD